MAIVTNGEYNTIGTIEYKYIWPTIIPRSNFGKTFDPKIDLVVKYFMYGIAEDGRFMVEPESEKTEPLSFFLSQIISDTNLQSPMYHAEMQSVGILNYLKGADAVSYVNLSA